MAILNEIPKDVTLVAVSKTKPIEMIMECYDIGQRDFGENKVQDLIAKKEVLPKDIRWHFIGKLQTNKVKYLVNNVHLIHSLSSIKLLGKIESEFGKNNLSADVLIQINIGREESKSGIYEEELEDMIKAVENCNHVNVKGLMVIIPKGTDEENRYYFNKTKKIFDNLKDRKLKNIRNTYIHQVTYDLVKTKPACIVIEDLNVKGMMKNKHLSKAIQQQEFYKFRQYISYKCQGYGVRLVVANRFYPSSKTCSCCGHKKKFLSLKERTYICHECGLVTDRDLNAAINLKIYGKEKLIKIA